MFSIIIRISIALQILINVEMGPVFDSKCSPSKLGCLCENLETITEKDVESCCDKKMETLLIMGLLVRNISVDIEKSNCSNSFINLIIRETGLVKFYSPFKGLKNVSYVHIAKNSNLSDFHKFVFEDLNPDIINISVEFNHFRSISRKTFANMRQLRTLRLSDNKIGYIEDRSFENLTSLELLAINSNILTILHSEVFYGLNSLKILSLLNNPLLEPKHGDFLKHLKNLREFSLSHGPQTDLKGFSELPENVFISARQLRNLSVTFVRLKNLTARSFYGLMGLERLDLQSNRLTLIPAGTLQQMHRIEALNLAKNQLSCLLANTFTGLPRLTDLDLSNNELSYISGDVFMELSALRFLDLNENNVYVINTNAFAGLISLITLRLNVVHGRAKNDIQRRFASSSLAKLRNTTRIVGLMDLGVTSRGLNKPTEFTLGNSSISTDICPIASLEDREWSNSSDTVSRYYLPVIVGICVVFLLIAFTVIMTYRAWSKGRREDVALTVDLDEKQEMLAANGRTIGLHQSRQSMNGGLVPEQQKQRHSNSQVGTKTTLSDRRSHSDDESALTPLGIL